MSPELQNLLLKSPAAQQADLDAMPAELRNKVEDELAEYYRHCLPDFDAFIWILRVPKHRFKRLCPSLQDAALRYATPEEQKFLRQQRNVRGPALICCLFFGSCTAAWVGTVEGEARDSPFLQWIGSAGSIVFSISIVAIFLLLAVSLFVWLTR